MLWGRGIRLGEAPLRVILNAVYVELAANISRADREELEQILTDDESTTTPKRPREMSSPDPMVRSRARIRAMERAQAARARRGEEVGVDG